MTPTFKSKNYVPKDTIHNVKKWAKEWKNGFFSLHFSIKTEYQAIKWTTFISIDKSEKTCWVKKTSSRPICTYKMWTHSNQSSIFLLPDANIYGIKHKKMQLHDSGYLWGKRWRYTDGTNYKYNVSFLKKNLKQAQWMI